MTERYFAKIVSILDEYTLVLNVGSNVGVNVGKSFLIVGLGDEIIDPDTKESLGRLEIVRGKGRVTHVQERMATVKTSELERPRDVKEIKKVSTAPKGTFASIFGPQETVTESIKPADPIAKPFAGAVVGDLAIEA